METFENKNSSDDFRFKVHLDNGNGRSHFYILGVVLITIGSALILKNIDFFPPDIGRIIFSWQMLLITIGLVITLGSSGEKTGGLVIMAIGAFFLIPRIFRETFDINIFWPAIFIIVGLIFIFSRRLRFRGHSEARVSDNFLDIVNIFSGSEKQVISENFRGGKITSIFGGSEIDLTQAKLAQGVSELEINCIFGGSSIIVPSDWNVKVEVTPVLGGVDEQKISSNKIIDMSKLLVIKGTVVFGGAEIQRR
jgi:predicted membrane protein